ncbi:PEP-CTERM sorting domain-containing protein [Nitrosovibrio sp. Nv4]|uniref:PEP-CTERM sorting domain-containing protein n=2 Tax=Nitrosovibrio sp. Nv4 TaxID=1945880 RepID=UPI0035124B4C
MYGYLNRVRSSRMIERETRRKHRSDVAGIPCLANLQDHSQLSPGACTSHCWDLLRAGYYYKRILSDVYLDNLVISTVPEPETYALMLAGLALIGFIAQRARRRKAGFSIN